MNVEFSNLFSRSGRVRRGLRLVVLVVLVVSIMIGGRVCVLASFCAEASDSTLCWRNSISPNFTFVLGARGILEDGEEEEENQQEQDHRIDNPSAWVVGARQGDSRRVLGSTWGDGHSTETTERLQATILLI